jgi:hypothetical protein
MELVGQSFDISRFFFFSLVALVAGGVGGLSFLAGVLSLARLLQRHRWLRRWSQTLRRLPGDLSRVRAGDLVCLEGNCLKTKETPLLVSPVFRTSCVAYWLEIRDGVLGRLTHRQSKVQPFRLELAQGGPEVLIDPNGAELIDLPGPGDFTVTDAAALDVELARHLETAAIRLGSAQPLGITQGRLVPGGRCTVIGRVERTSHAASPYRTPEGSVVGGGGTLMVATTDRAGLERKLAWQRGVIVLRAGAAAVAVGGSLGLMAAAAILQPIMALLMVGLGAPLLGWAVHHQLELMPPMTRWPSEPAPRRAPFDTRA